MASKSPQWRKRLTAVAVAMTTSALVLTGCNGLMGNSAQVPLDMASWISPDTGPGQAIRKWINEVENKSGGEIDVTEFWNGELFGAAEIKDGLTDGRVQLGNLATAYTPTEFPITQMVEVPFLGGNIGAQATALNRMYRENGEFRSEWEDRAGIKVLSFIPVSPTVLGTKSRVDSIDWFPGKTVRATGSFGAAIAAVGGNPAPIEIGETYEALQRGTAEAYGGVTLDHLPSSGLYEVGPYIQDVGLGHYAAPVWSISMATWEGLSSEHKQILETVSQQFPSWIVETTIAAEDAGCGVVLEAGGTVTAFPATEVERWKRAIGDKPFDAWAARVSEQTDVEDPKALYNQMVGYYREAAEGEFVDLKPAAQRCEERARR